MADTSAPSSGKNLRKLPRKRDYRTRAHANPLSANRFGWCPTSPADFDWSKLYTHMKAADGTDKQVEFADIGCGFGGLTVALAEKFPETLVLGMEIREQVVKYVEERIELARETSNGTKFGNASVLRVNAMQDLPCYFRKGQLKKIFFLFPDPHFKKKNHKRRIISQTLLAEYAYVLAEGAIVYTITDVLDLHQWMVKHLDAHPLFVRIPDEELTDDPCIELVRNSSDEAKKVEAAKGDKYLAVYRRICV
mmetsp:Transcript_15560/g.39743  ORF Transcript_15560/g.39743 Transcript_15560/m.39743 type:complete len:250 (+) Transcript_15560:95-844(+)